MAFDIDNAAEPERPLQSRFDTPVWMLAVSQTLVWATIFYSFPALVLHWQAEFGWTSSEIMGAFTCALFGWAVVAPVCGSWIDRGGGALLMAGSAVAGAAILSLLLVIETLLPFYLIWIGVGMTMGGALYEACFAVVTRARGARARQAITLITLVAGLASTLCYPLVHWISEYAGWRPALLTLCAGTVFAAAPLSWYAARRLERTHSDELRRPPVTDERIRSVRLTRRPVFWFLALGFAMLALQASMTTSHIMPLLADRTFPPDLAVLAASSIGPMQVAGRLAVMIFGSAVEGWKVAGLSFLSMALAALCLLLADGSVLLLAAFVVLHGAGWGLTSILRPVVTRDILGQADFGAVSGAVAVPSLVAFAAAPLLGSLLAGAGGYSLVLSTGAFFCAAGFALFMASTRGLRATVGG